MRCRHDELKRCDEASAPKPIVRLLSPVLAGRRCGRPTTVVQGPLAVAKAEAEACSKALDRRALVASVISLPLVTTLPCRGRPLKHTPQISCNPDVGLQSTIAVIDSIRILTGSADPFPLAAEGPSKYVDPTNKYQIDVPEGACLQWPA